MTDKEKTRDEKREARESRRKLKETLRREMQEDQIEEIEEIAEELGLENGFVIVQTDTGVMACKKATAMEMSRFKKEVTAPAGRNGKKKGPTTEESTFALVRSARIYPDTEEFEALMIEYSFCWDKLGEGIVALDGADFEFEVRKN